MGDAHHRMSDSLAFDSSLPVVSLNSLFPAPHLPILACSNEVSTSASTAHPYNAALPYKSEPQNDDISAAIIPSRAVANGAGTNDEDFDLCRKISSPALIVAKEERQNNYCGNGVAESFQAVATGLSSQDAKNGDSVSVAVASSTPVPVAKPVRPLSGRAKTNSELKSKLRLMRELRGNGSSPCAPNTAPLRVCAPMENRQV